jgi:hypothetical protein
VKYIIIFLLSTCSLQLYAQHDHEIPPTGRFTVSGIVKHEIKFRTDNLSGYTQDSLGDVIMRNKKGEQKGIAKHLKGILLKTILDSAAIIVGKPKEYGELVITLTASDGYQNVYSWNELFNTEIGNHVYIITEMDGKSISEMPDRILVLSLSDFNSGSRHLKALSKIEIKKAR